MALLSLKVTTAVTPVGGATPTVTALKSARIAVPNTTGLILQSSTVGPPGPQGPPGPPGGPGGGGGYSVTDSPFNATGNGTTDDTAAVQAAVNAAHAVGGAVVFFPAGTYRITSALTLYSYVRLVGASMKTTTIRQISTTANGVFGHELEGAGIEELTILGPGSGSGQGVFFDRATSPAVGINYRINMRRVMVDSFGGDGLHVQQCIVSSFDTVEVRQCGGHGFDFHGVSGGAAGTSVNFKACYSNANSLAGYRISTMTYCSLDACATDSCGVGYLVDNSGGIVLNGCGAEALVNTSPTYPGDAIQINVCSGVVVNTGFLYDVVRHGVLVTGSRGVVLNGVREFRDIGGGANSVNFQSSTGTVIGLSHSLPVSYDLASFVTQLDIDGAGGYKLPGAATFTDIQMAAGINPALAVRVIGDAQARFFMDANGAHYWGPGSAGNDATIYRSAPGILSSGATFIPSKLGAGNSLPATGPVGAIVGKFQVTDVNGTNLGYVPVYNTIT